LRALLVTMDAGYRRSLHTQARWCQF